MSELLALAVDLATEEPETAAAVLVELAPETAAGFLAALPDDQGADVLAALPSFVAADCLAHLPEETAADWLDAVGYPLRTRIARALPADLLARLLERMPKAAARQVRRDIAYVPDSIGAWMEEAPGVVQEDETVGECLARLRRQRHAVEPTLVVTGKGRRYVGLLTLGRLLKAADRRTVGPLAETGVAPLDPEAPLSEAAGRPEWNTHLLLPVAGLRNSFLGVLRIERLKSALAHEEAGRAEPGSGLVGHLLEAALISAVGMSALLPGADSLED